MSVTVSGSVLTPLAPCQPNTGRASGATPGVVVLVRGSVVAAAVEVVESVPAVSVVAVSIVVDVVGSTVVEVVVSAAGAGAGAVVGAGVSGAVVSC
jgi:hypothetical protein